MYSLYAVRYVYTHTLRNIEKLGGANKKEWDRSECRMPGKTFRVPFWAREPWVRLPWPSVCD